jgi:hypothetical protein
MKNLSAFCKVLCLVICLAFLVNPVQSQEYARDFSSSVRMNEINPQAFRHFKKNYPEVSNEYWYKSSTGFVVKYIDKNIVSQAFYDHRGAFVYGIKYCEEKDLDKEMKLRINKEFPGYIIDVASEVVSNENIIYLLSLKNKMTVKNIIITETELKVIEDILYASR